MIILSNNKLRQRYKFIALCLQGLNHAFQCLGGIFCTIVTQNNGTVSEVFMVTNGIDDGIDAVVLPIEAVNIGNKNKV